MTLNQTKVGFIGCGKMGGALIKGLLDSGKLSTSQVFGNDIAAFDWRSMLSGWGASPVDNPSELVKKCDVIVLATKPQGIFKVLETIKDVSENKLFISVAAGVTTKSIEERLNKKARVVRVMPNTPALIGQGAAGVAGGKTAIETDILLAVDLMNCVGISVMLPEQDLDIVTGMSGTGPAFTFLFIEGLVDAAVRLGLNWDTAKTLAIQVVKGAAILAQQKDVHLAQLRNEVTSPGGTSAAGLQVLESAGFKAIISAAVEASTRRSAELAQAAEDGSLGTGLSLPLPK